MASASRTTWQEWPLRTYMAIFKQVVKRLPFRWPVVRQGEGSAAQLLDDVKMAGHTRLLIVTDSSIRGLGLLDEILHQAQARELTLHIIDTIAADPGADIIDQAAESLKAFQPQAVLAVGGGSVIDAAKMIGAVYNNKRSILSMAGMFRVRRGMLPLYVAPTTAGTGSEATIAAVFSDPKQPRKLSVLDLKLMPTAVALDPLMTKGLPPAITAATGMDALTHAIEAYLSRNAWQATDELALQAARLINTWLSKAYSQGDNLEARQQMAYAAMLAGQAFTQAGVGYVHAIAHGLGARYHIPHGRANAMVLPSVLVYSQPACLPRMAELAKAMGLQTASGDTSNKAFAEALIARVKQLNQRFSIPTTVAELKAEDIPALVREARREARFTYAVPRYLSQSAGETLVEGLLDNV